MTSHRRFQSIASIIALAQLPLALRVFWRLSRTGRQRQAVPQRASNAIDQPTTVIVPVLNERERLAPCLVGLLAQPGAVEEILVVDGGSTDGTQDLVRDFTARDSRVRLIDASPVPTDWNGKAWGLQRGLDHARAQSKWILTIDADVRPRAELTTSLLAFAHETGLSALSVATRQQIETRGEGLVHPSLLTTLVYRFGIPGSVAKQPHDVQANGQCFLIGRDLLCCVGGFAVVKGSICEDVTLAREVVASGHEVGFFEAGDLVNVRMYADGWTTLREWPRSLPMRDRFFGWRGVLGLLEVFAIQALPLPLLAWFRLIGAPRWTTSFETILTISRLGVLVGTRRAYHRPPWTYWLSPLLDMTASTLLLASTMRRRYVWRGRSLARGGTS